MKTIEELAREAGFDNDTLCQYGEGIWHNAMFCYFAKLIRAQALEEAADRCEQVAAHDLSLMPPKAVAEYCAGAIRAAIRSLASNAPDNHPDR